VSKVEYLGVEKRFGDVTALERFDLVVPDGAFLVMLGPSGCGKTTALRILAGLELPTAGRVLLGDNDVTRLQPRDRDIAMVFQSYALYPHMTVGANIGYPLKLRNVDKPARAKAVGHVAELLEIAHLLDRRPRQLSGGQRQRVALARAIVREPACFLMDEPLSNLDAKLRASMRGEIKRLQKRLAATTIYVTHDQAEATTMADLVAVMRDGVLQQLAPPVEIYDRPANRFVGTFVGSPPLNAVPGALDADRHTFVVADTALRLPDAIFRACAPHMPTELGVRPEDLTLCDPAAAGALRGDVYVVEPLGNETLVEVHVAATVVVVRAERGWDAPIGSPVGITFDIAAACFFAENGETVVQRSDREEPTRPMATPASGQGISGQRITTERSPS
jgi:multiple sugar transport system ATP-binding protein